MIRVVELGPWGGTAVVMQAMIEQARKDLLKGLTTVNFVQLFRENRIYYAVYEVT